MIYGSRSEEYPVSDESLRNMSGEEEDSGRLAGRRDDVKSEGARILTLRWMRGGLF